MCQSIYNQYNHQCLEDLSNMKKIALLLIGIIILTFGGYCVYYFYPRKVSFELTKEISKPNDFFDYSQFLGFNYIRDEKLLMYWLVDFYKKTSCIRDSLFGYDTLFVQNLSKELDFDKYDYLITYHKKLNKLTYSPYLAKKEDFCGYLKEKPLIPTLDTVITDKVYIYRIKKTDKFRSPCP